MDIIQYLFSETEFLSVSDILINIIFAGMMAFLVRMIYIKYGNSLSNRKQFSSNFFNHNINNLDCVNNTNLISAIIGACRRLIYSTIPQCDKRTGGIILLVFLYYTRISLWCQ